MSCLFVIVVNLLITYITYNIFGISDIEIVILFGLLFLLPERSIIDGKVEIITEELYYAYMIILSTILTICFLITSTILGFITYKIFTLLGINSNIPIIIVCIDLLLRYKYIIKYFKNSVKIETN
jgi:hypothetical protein